MLNMVKKKEYWNCYFPMLQIEIKKFYLLSFPKARCFFLEIIVLLYHKMLILAADQRTLSRHLEEYEDIILSNSSDIGYTKFIEIDMVTDPNLPPVASKPYNLPLKHCKWVQKQLEDLEEAGNIQWSVSPYVSSIVIAPRKASPGAPLHETKML